MGAFEELLQATVHYTMFVPQKHGPSWEGFAWSRSPLNTKATETLNPRNPQTPRSRKLETVPKP